MNDPNPSATGSQYPSPAAMQQQQQQQYASSGQQQQQQPQPQPPQEQYRGSPPGSHMSQPPPPLLPPIQHLEGQGPPPMQQQPQHYPQPPINGAQMQYGHAPSPPNLYPYPPDGAIAPNGVPNGHTAMRYPLPPQSMDARNMSGGRHKKEIKRRTKTGCLTCRKRRIKCDEGHPTCRNCAKSKRECLGYDPIFKPQAAPAPIQPAPGAAAHSPVKAEPAPSNTVQHPPQHHQYPPPPQGYAPAVSAGYPPGPSPNVQLEHPYDFGNAIDPALGDEHTSNQMSTYTTTLRPERYVKMIGVDDLFALNHHVPPVPPPRENDASVTEPQLNEIRAMYRQEYAPALDRFLETTWYTAQGEVLLTPESETSRFFVYCVDRFRQLRPDRDQEMVGLPSLEARLIWKLAELPKSADSKDTQKVLQRLDIIERLLTGQFLDEHNVPQETGDQHDTFWIHLGRFLSAHDDTGDQAQLNRLNQALAQMRQILNMQENRDVIYSMAIARHYGGRTADFHADKTLVATSNDPEDSINKLVVAQRFLGQEETNGTTQVVQRFCGMAKRSWEMLRPQITKPRDA